MKSEHVEQYEIDVLMALNSAVVTSRLYPASAPQVRNSLERGFKALSECLSVRGAFSIGLVSGVKVINNKGVEEEVIAGLTNLVVFRQMELLNVPVLFLEAGLDQFTFSQIVSVFTAKTEKIKREGGGREYITSLGLISFFPESLADCVEQKKADAPVEKKTTVTISPQLLAALFGREHSPDVLNELHETLNKTTTGVDLLSAAIGRLLVVLSKRSSIAVAPEFSAMLERVDKFIVSDERVAICRKLSSVMASSLQVAALSVLLAQRFSSNFGKLFYQGIVTALDDGKLRQILELYRKYIAQLEGSSADSHQLLVLQEALDGLQENKRVKLFLSKEKADDILVRGEVERLRSRLNTSVAGILHGNFSSLANPEFLRQIPQIITSLARQKNEVGLTFITVLAQQLGSLEGTQKRDLASALLLAAETLLVEKKWKWLYPMIDSFLSWLTLSSVADFIYEKIATVLYRFMVDERREGLYTRSDEILTLFYKIRTGEARKSDPVRALIGRIQDKAIDRKSLPSMLVECLENPADEAASRRLALQGPVVARYLVDTLISTEKTEHRIKVLDLLTYSKSILPSIIIERLGEHMSWYGKRNLIKLLSESGGEEHATEVLPYISHEDLRVQREAFLCLNKIGGKYKKDLLLRAMQDASEATRIQLIRTLGALADEEVAIALCGLLREYAAIKERDTSVIILQLLKVLSFCYFAAVEECLQEFVLSKRGRDSARFDESIWDRAEDALEHVGVGLGESKRKKHIQVSQLRKNSQRQATRLSPQPGDVQALVTNLPEERLIRDLFARGNSEVGARQLLRLIEQLARSRSFAKAEKLRNWLIEVAPTMLTDIIRAAEIIEEEKNTSVDKEHIEIWHALYDLLTTEEFSALYHYLKHMSLPNDQLIVRQGADQKSLYFINSGTIKVFYNNHGAETLIKTVSAGTVLGAGPFFDASVWTFSVACVGRSEISVLNLDDIGNWAEEYPALESKLQDFCHKFEKVEDFFKNTSRDRREHTRVNVKGRLAAQLLDDKGQHTGVMPKGDLCDISAGGISFTIRLSRRSNARILLGRKVKIFLPSDGLQDGSEIGLTGDVIAVRSQLAMENEYSVHVKFDDSIDAPALKLFIIALRRREGVK